MNIELEKTFSFPAILVGSEQGPWINRYEVRVHIRVITDQGSEYNTAYERMKFWFYDIMHSAVLVPAGDPKLQSWRDTGLACLDFPEKPLDHVVGLMLMSKLTAMVEGRLEILRVGVSSAADDDVVYLCDQGDHLHWFEEPGWWQDPGPTHSNDARRGRKSGKVISISQVQDWKQHELDWNVNTDNTASVATITSFTKDEKK